MATAGGLTENLTLNTLDYIAAYIAVSLGTCVFVSFFLFVLALFLRGVLFRKTIFLKGMAWGILFITPFLGKLKLFYEVDFFYWWLDRWLCLCDRYWWIRHGYVLGMIICAGILFSGRRRLHRVVKHMKQAQVCGQKIRVNELAVTPFTTGLFKPQIVLPEILWKEMPSGEVELILFHEQTHIRLGHLWLYLLWDIIQILLWPNFLFGLFRQSFQMDLEEICDKVTIQNSSQSASDYGMLLLKSMRLLEPKSRGAGTGHAATAFAEERNYRDVRRRISQIAVFKPYRVTAVRALCISSAALLTGIFLMIAHHSYPFYTELDEIALYPVSQEVPYIILNKGEFEQALSWDDEYVYIQRAAMDRILEEYDIEGERFWIGFGGYTKNPRMGSSGNCVDVDYRGQSDNLCVPYWSNEKNFWVALLKQMP